MGYKRIPENPEKPICYFTGRPDGQDGFSWSPHGLRPGRCITAFVYHVLAEAGQRDKAQEWEQRCCGQKLNYKRRLQLAFKYVEVR